MFGKRCDGRRLKSIDPFMKLIPYIMERRTDSQVMYEKDIDCVPFDHFIQQYIEKGIRVTYMHIVLAALIRTIAQRPSLNRFVMNSRLYTRHQITVSLSVHRSLRGDMPETTVKIAFDGTENIFEIAEKIERQIDEDTKEVSANNTDKLAGIVMSVPSIFIKAVVNLCKFLDRRDLLPKSIVQASPFHTTIFITNLKSIGLDYVYHHLYEFGTTGLFVSIGKEKMKPMVVKRTEIQLRKTMKMGLVADERICDGLYLARSYRIFYKYLEDPSLLCERLNQIVPDVP